MLALPPIARAQTQSSKARVGVLFQGTLAAGKHLLDTFKDEMAKSGWREGVNIEYAFREALNDTVRLDALAAELVSQRMDVIVVAAAPVALAVRKHTKSIPIVFWVVADPIAAGLVASLAKPGGNATGITWRFEGLWGKRLQLLQELIPSLRRVGLLYDPADAQDAETAQVLQAVGKNLSIDVELFRVSHPREFRAAFMEMKNAKISAAMIGGGNMFFVQRKLIADLGLEHRIATSRTYPEDVEAGMLASYGVNLSSLIRRGARFTDRILKGAKPADLPVEQPSVLELMINLKTAKALGIKIPPSILLRADRVIE